MRIRIMNLMQPRTHSCINRGFAYRSNLLQDTLEWVAQCAVAIKQAVGGEAGSPLVVVNK